MSDNMGLYRGKCINNRQAETFDGKWWFLKEDGSKDIALTDSEAADYVWESNWVKGHYWTDNVDREVHYIQTFDPITKEALKDDEVVPKSVGQYLRDVRTIEDEGCIVQAFEGDVFEVTDGDGLVIGKIIADFTANFLSFDDRIVGQYLGNVTDKPELLEKSNGNRNRR